MKRDDTGQRFKALRAFFDAYWPMRHLSAERRVLRNIIAEMRRERG